MEETNNKPGLLKMELSNNTKLCPDSVSVNSIKKIMTIEFNNISIDYIKEKFTEESISIISIYQERVGNFIYEGYSIKSIEEKENKVIVSLIKK